VKTTSFGKWESMERTFLPKTADAAKFNAAVSAVWMENARHFWEYQEKAWHDMQSIADRWFERRRIETQKTREAAEKMCRFESFEDVFRTYRDWAIGAFDRITGEARSRVPGWSHLQEVRK
jgi:hypothetical protein